MILSRFTLFCSRFGIELEILIEKGRDGLTLCHPKLEKQIEDIVSLGDHDAIRSLNYLYSQKVMELLHVFHFESTREKLFYMLNICQVLSSNDQLINIYYDKYMSSGVALDEQRVAKLGHFEADLVKILGYLQMPCVGVCLRPQRGLLSQHIVIADFRACVSNKAGPRGSWTREQRGRQVGVMCKRLTRQRVRGDKVQEDSFIIGHESRKAITTTIVQAGLKTQVEEKTLIG